MSADDSGRDTFSSVVEGATAVRTGPDRPKVYCFINAGSGTDWVVSMAMAEDGTVLTSHVSSSDGFAKGDSGYLETSMGLTKRRLFAEHYPDGYEAVWVEDVANDPDLLAAYERNQARRPNPSESGSPDHAEPGPEASSS